MNDSLNSVIQDLENQLADAQRNIEWYHQRFKEYNEKAIKLKEAIAELKAMKTVMA